MNTQAKFGVRHTDKDAKYFNIEGLQDGKVTVLVNIDFLAQFDHYPFTIEEKLDLIKPFFEKYVKLVEKHSRELN